MFIKFIINKTYKHIIQGDKDMSKLCFLNGKVLSKKYLKFESSKNEKELKEKHICIIKMEIENKQIIWLKAYNEIAEYVYKNLKKGDNISVQGLLQEDIIEIEKISKV